MKIYTFDLGCRGGLVVVAKTPEEAHEKLWEKSSDYRYALSEDGQWEYGNPELEEHSLNEDFYHNFLGDS